MDALGLKQLLIHKETIEKDVDASFLHVVLENGGPAALTDEAYRRRADGVKVAAAQFCNNHPPGVVD